MSVVDYFLNSLVRYLQKKQKARQKKKKTRVRPKRSVKPKKVTSKRQVSNHRAQKKSHLKTPKGVKKKISLKKKKQSVRPQKKGALRGSRARAKVKTINFKRAVKKVLKSTADQSKNKEITIGVVTHYFSQIQVIVVKITNGKIHIGDKIHIKGKKTDFLQMVKSLQIESVDVKVANRGQLVGLKVNRKVKVGDKIFK